MLETFPGAKLIDYTGASGPGAESAPAGDDGETPADAPADAAGDDGLEQIGDPDGSEYGDDIDPNDPRFQ